MGRLTIYREAAVGNPTVVAVCSEVEYHGGWMEEEYVTVKVQSPTPVAFSIDDYVTYRGQRYSISYDPQKLKKASSGSHGEGFTYDGLKLYSDGSRLKDVAMKDVVLNDNQLSYTSLGKFSFYCQSVEDLADRIQANLNRNSSDWRVLTPNWNRTNVRLEFTMQDSTERENLWGEYYDGSESAGKTEINISIDDNSCWDALKCAYNDFGLSYRIVGKTVVIGGKPIDAGHVFMYGKNNGLREISDNGTDDQRIVTKLFAYGSENNLPLNYYGNTLVICNAPILQKTQSDLSGGTSFYHYIVDVKYDRNLFTRSIGTDNYQLTLKKESGDGAHTSRLVFAGKPSSAVWSDEVMQQYRSKVEITVPTDSIVPEKSIGGNFEIVGGLNKNLWPQTLCNKTDANYPGALSVNRLMLPGFPQQSVKDYFTTTSNWSKYHEKDFYPHLLEIVSRIHQEYGTLQWGDIYLSEDAYDPYITSGKCLTIGAREGTVNFDGNGNTQEILPSIAGGTDNVVLVGSSIEDNGYVQEADDFDIWIKDAAIAWDELYGAAIETVVLSMTSGYCTGRDFEVSGVERTEKNGVSCWKFTLKRSPDSSMNRLFPYADSGISGYCQIAANDTFVVTGIELPDEYVEEASVRLFIAAVDALDELSEPKRSYSPKIDQIFMQRDLDENGQSAMYYKLYPGIGLSIKDTDLAIDKTVYIDTLTIKEFGDAEIATYDVTLRDEKELGLMEQIQVSVGGGVQTRGGSATAASEAQTASESARSKSADRLSGNEAHNAWGQTYWQDGRPKDVAGSLTGVEDVTMSGNLSIGEGFGIERDGDAVLNDVSAEDVSALDIKVGNVTSYTEIFPDGIVSSGFSSDLLGSGFRLMTDGESGLSELIIDKLTVRLKAVFAELEIRKVSHAGGNLIFSAAASKIEEVIAIDIEMLPTDVAANIAGYKCYIMSDDGTTATTNGWVIGDQAKCQTFNIDAGKHTGVGNRYYWRKVVAKGEENGQSHDTGRKREWIVLASKAQTSQYENGAQNIAPSGQEPNYGDAPQAGDTIVLLGHQRNLAETDMQAAERQNAIAIEANDTTAPAIYKYHGINNFSLNGKMVQADFYDTETHQYRSITYGDWYVGANTKIVNGNRVPISSLTNPFSDEAETYIKYEQAHNFGTVSNPSYAPLLSIKALIDADSPFGGTAETIGEIVLNLNDALYGLSEEVDGLGYLKTALAAISGSTQIGGGLVLTNYIALKDSNEDITAGITGLTNRNNTNVNPANIAAWFGGNPFASPAVAPKIVFKFDGSGYLAGENITWDALGNTEVKGTIKAKNLFHGVCMFGEVTQDLGTYKNGRNEGTAYVPKDANDHYVSRTIYTTGDADVVYMTPLRKNGSTIVSWARDMTYAEDEAIPDVNDDWLPNRWGRTLFLPSPQEYEGKVVEIFISSNGDASEQERQGHGAGWGIEKNIQIMSVSVDDGDLVFHQMIDSVLYDPSTGNIPAIQGGDVISQPVSIGYLRFMAVQGIDPNGNPQWVWIFSTGMGGKSVTNIYGNVVYSQGASEAWVKDVLIKGLDDNHDIITSEPYKPFLQKGDNITLLTNNAGYATEQYVQNNYMMTSERGNYVSKSGDTMNGALTVNGNIATGSGNAYKVTVGSGTRDILKYDPNAGHGISSGAHWFVGIGQQGVVISSGALERYNGSTAYTIWDESNFTPSNYLLSSAISDWAKAANKPAYNLDEVSDGTTRKLANYLPLTGGTVESLTVTNGLDADAITVGSIVNSNTLAEYLDADAMQTWLQQQGYITQTTADGRYIKGVSVYGSSLTPDSNRVVNVPYADINTAGVIQIGTGLVNDNEGHTTVDTSVIASRQWANSQFVTITGQQTISGAKTFSNGLASGGNISMDALTEITFDVDSAVGINSNDVLYLHGNNGILLSDDTTVNGSIAVSNGLTSTSRAATTINHNGIDVTIGGFDATLIEYAAGDTNYAIARFGIKPQVLTGSNTYSDVALVSDIGTVLTGISFSSTGQAYVFKKNVVTGEGTGELVNTPYALAAQLGGYVPLNGNSTITGNTKIKSQLDIVDSSGTSKIALFGNSGQIHATNVYIGGTATGNLAATRTWVGQQGYQTNVIEGVTAFGTSCPITNKIAEIPMASNDGSTFGVVAIGTGFTFDENRLCVDTSTFATRTWADSRYLPLTAGSSKPLTGNIAYKGTKATKEMITFIDNQSDQWGNGIAIGGGGATIIGGGESAVTMIDQLPNVTVNGVEYINGGSEVMYIGNDTSVSIFTNLGTASGWANRKEFFFDTGGSLSVPFNVVSKAPNNSAFRLQGANYDIGLHLGLGGTNRGIYEFSPKNNWLLYFDASNTILNYGNVGIGTTTPNYKLDVSGNFHASGNAIVDGSVLMGNVSSGIEIKYDRIDWIDRSGNSPWTMGAMIFHYDGNVSTDDVTVRFELRPQVLTGSNTYTNVALTTDIPSVPSGRTMYFGNCQIFTNSSGTAGTELYLSGNSVHVTSNGVFTFNNEQVVTSSGVAFASKSNNKWALAVYEVNASGNANISGSLTANGITCEDVLEVQSDIIIDNQGDGLCFGPSSNAPRLYVYNGSLYYNNTMIADGSSNGSDIRMKDVIKYLEPSVRDVAFAPLIEFGWKEGYGGQTASHSIGSIAQYWQSVFPQAVYEGKGGMLCLDYGVLGLASAITAARHSLDNERRIAELELRVAELEDELAAMVSQQRETTDN